MKGNIYVSNNNKVNIKQYTKQIENLEKHF